MKTVMTSSNRNIFRVTGPFVRGIHRWPVNSPHKGQWRGALMFSLICALNNRLSKQSWGWWFETPSCPSQRHCNALTHIIPDNHRSTFICVSFVWVFYGGVVVCFYLFVLILFWTILILIVEYLPPSHYLNQCWYSINWIPRKNHQWNLNQNASSIQEKWIWKCRLANDCYFVLGPNV